MDKADKGPLIKVIPNNATFDRFLHFPIEEAIQRLGQGRHSRIVDRELFALGADDECDQLRAEDSRIVLAGRKHQGTSVLIYKPLERSSGHGGVAKSQKAGIVDRMDF